MNRSFCLVLGGALLLAQAVLAAGDGWQPVGSHAPPATPPQPPARRPVVTTTWQEQPRRVLSERFVTEMREHRYTVWVPVVEQRSEPRWHNWWNPLAPSYLTYETRPQVRWQPQTVTQRLPVHYRRVVAEERLVRVPVRTLGFADRPASAPPVLAPHPLPPAGAATARTASRVGGISRIEYEPPRHGMPASDAVPTWRR